ncbi:bifunctional hydroxymethylpyrimidine kinase/phosphomethylpyrimidine kinase [Paucibacter sp. PLA-PC-4]|uniref:bifunctional hydroxymethylpyrimidine kinase/phosphomethylpyrimidine kinase n=1 Tax=Paucibacter sp. PLA-PC-4 TaxID=2993655 RepID=UPI002249A1E4|nr:bifunctional hydroxymethylpyrimidine kinase/phosphomethylpyrimidine kinase [Paucibacter sp. PLA-PC-4]MCX2861560.1 bifunctional hydroxymethylpyrimidine kinase/phosphomethylpyrimidine kinase [Paucibacter sp. PLA-PC-4]
MNEVIHPHPSLPSPWVQARDPGSDRAPPWTQDPTPPVVWSVAGTDSGGGAGLSADTRAAAALGVHLCPVVAAITAQNSVGVQAVFPLPGEQLQAQLSSLATDMPPRVIKTGLLASVAAVRSVAEMVDALRRERGFVGLVVDPVLCSTAGGAYFADEALIAAYREWLLPRASLVTPNRREAARLTGLTGLTDDVPAMAAALRQLGSLAVCITGGDDAAELALDWWDGILSPWQPELGRTTGWLALPRVATRHHHGSGCSFATAAAAAMARGFPLPDATVLAKMLSWTALRDGHAAGAGAGPLRPGPAFIAEPQAMPVMSFGAEPLDAATLIRWGRVLRGEVKADFRCGLYAITDDAARVAELAGAGLFPQIQLRVKAEAQVGQDLRMAIRAALRDAGCGSQLWINDHWRLALEEGAMALHLGQQDWAALRDEERSLLLREREVCGLKLGISSHSLWELARARGLAPSYIACGPVWPTTTKDMPWLPQGLSQLRWWTRMAGTPVLGIGGVLSTAQAERVARTGVAGVCLVSALNQGAAAWTAYSEAWMRGQWAN